ncbi:TAXI family TRAP transporter solute-binding subunit [Amycolatopsis rhizosphaerae]|uniref:TAXI family TRAP transporter solute-binding subunit n=1 Tax=Amycolatopsis rhizosphaerae TaxID=2053003 RepID=A0A558CFD9_9PSEU|nr:TAXI family TRAP transporter solute-binding subunit [Amycolatopsis rhizosphaerae]TVT47489.1 TAXI family TRAP transporter solute-binding subunit [Amycolatopsis rhizosphaerae]
MITRRTLLRTGVALAATGAGLTAAAPPAASGPSGRMRIATGEESGFYLAFGQLLATELHTAYPGLDCVAMPTPASVANLILLEAGQAELAITLSDIAEDALAGRDPFPRPVPLRALGRVYENYLQLAVRADSPVTALPELAGRSVSLGASGSGGAVLGERLVRGLRDVSVRHLSMTDAARALAARELDAMLVSGGVPLPVLSVLDNQIGIRLLPLTPSLPALRTTVPGSEVVRLPAGAYRHGGEVDTIGMANLLVCRPELPAEVASDVTQLLVRRAGQLVPAQAVGTQFLDVRTLIGTGDVPLHPGAANAYRALHG